MNRYQLEHIIRAAASVADTDELIIVGSQSILGQFPTAPASLTISMEADVYPKHEPDKSIVIDGSLGELSIFHQTYGYYAHGVGAETAILPRGWEGRLVPVQNENTRNATGWCLEAHDLAASKLAAGREKDIEFVKNMLKAGLADPAIVAKRVNDLDIPVPELKDAVVSRLSRILAPPVILLLPSDSENGIRTIRGITH